MQIEEKELKYNVDRRNRAKQIMQIGETELNIMQIGETELKR